MKKKVFIITSLVLAAAICCAAAIALTQDGKTGIVTVTAKATANVEPDVAYITLGVNTFDKNSNKATTDNAKKMNEITSALVKAGVKAENIETSYVSMYPSYNYDSGVQELRGYEVSNTISVTADDIAKVSEIVNTAMSSGANTLQGVNYQLKDTAKTYKSLLPDAVAKAKEKAMILAGSAGRVLGGVNSITENGYSDYYYNNVSYSFNAEMGTATNDAGGIGDTIKPGSISVSAEVTVEYELQ